jgi:PAS domain S-box-containing protein
MNILVLEDCNADFMLVERHLRQHGLTARCSRVETLSELKEAIGREGWDLVLSDYNVPQLDFQEGLNLLLDELSGVPIIMVTGSLGEEKAVELLKRGVHDFVLKGNLARLVPAIERSLKDASERKDRLEIERTLRNSEVHFRSIFNRSPIAIGIGKSTSGLVVEVNDALLTLYGYEREEMVGRTTTQLNLYANPDERVEIVRLISQCGQVVNREVQVRKKSGEILTVLYSAELIELRNELFLQVMLTDITERKKLEEQIRQSHKMHAIGQLAGGVAHDFNNILSAIYGYSYMIKRLVKDNDPVKNFIEEIIKASARAAALTSSLLTFSRKQAITLVEIDLGLVIRENDAFLRRLIREDIELKIICTGESLPVLADRGQIEQVFMNLVANARDAMPKGGTISIEIVPVLLDQEFIETQGYGTAGSYVLLSVFDTGVGMDKHTQSHIFEPFFTTKVQGEGTGLGLSLAYGIIKKHDGFIAVESEPGNGTVFRIYLPRAQTTVQAGNVESESVAVQLGGNETILVCEDDPVVLRLSMELLELHGYRVIGAVDGQDAVAAFTKNVESIQLVVLDEVMPKKNGRAAFQEMCLIRPELKAVFVSGYGEVVFAECSSHGGNAMFIQKPFPPVELMAQVRKLLDKTSAPGSTGVAGYD